jgi:hypothetical protein
MVVAVGVLAASGLARAAGDDEGDQDTDVEDPAATAPAEAHAGAVLDDRGVQRVHREGDYGGVSPGRAEAAGEARPGKLHKHVARASTTPLVTWIGFQVRDGGAARVFVQLSLDAPYAQNVAGDKLVVFVTGARLGKRNSSRFIDTSFFDTRVARIEARNVGARRGQKPGVELTMHFKKGSAAQAEARLDNGEDGHRYLFLDFAP